MSNPVQVMLVGTAPWLGRLGRAMTPIARPDTYCVYEKSAILNLHHASIVTLLARRERIRRMKSFLKFESHRHYVDFRGKVRSVTTSNRCAQTITCRCMESRLFYVVYVNPALHKYQVGRKDLKKTQQYPAAFGIEALGSKHCLARNPPFVTFNLH